MAGDGGDGLARGQAARVRAVAQLTAGGQDGRPAAAVDGAIDAAAAQQRGVRGVDHRVGILLGDVPEHRDDVHA
jgi:hypothetical protein